MGSITRTFANSISANGVTAVAPGTVAPEDTTTGTLGIPAVTSDPPGPGLNPGDIWIRTDLSSNQLKGWLAVNGSFSALPDSPYPAFGGAATGTAGAGAMICRYGGHPRVGGENGARGYDHQSFDNTTWTQETDFPYANSGCFLHGTQSDGVAGGGHGNPAGPALPIPGQPTLTRTAISYEWNGTTWGSSASLNEARSGMDGTHSPSASDAFVAGGWIGPSSAKVQLYNGTSWSDLGSDMPYAVQNQGTTGPSTDHIVYGGYAGGAIASSISWNGSSWSAEPSLNSARTELASSSIGSGSGTAFALAGNPGASNGNSSEVWNGTSWNTDATNPAADGTNAGGRSFGGVGATDATSGIIAGFNDGTAKVSRFNGPGFGVVNLN